MPGTTLEPKRTVIPVRACSRCDAVDSVFRLTMVDHAWLCASCHRAMVSAWRCEAREPVGWADADSVRDARLVRRDLAARVGAFGLKLTCYALLAWLGARNPLVAAVLLGFFIGDAFGWALHAWFDARFHRGAITAEAVFYTLLFVGLQHGGALDLPADVSERWLAGQTAGLMLAYQGIRFWCRLRE